MTTIGDERISGIHIGLTCIKALFDNVVRERNEQIKKESEEISKLLEEPVRYRELPTALSPTGMSNNIPGDETNQIL